MPGRALKLTRDGLAAQLGRRLQTLAMMACGRLLRWHELSRQRRALLGLNERMLKDIGITRLEAEREARRPFWSDGISRRAAPAHCASGATASGASAVIRGAAPSDARAQANCRAPDASARRRC
jgi:uncharacterized protein YjiS (DUF1127 family)